VDFSLSLIFEMAKRLDPNAVTEMEFSKVPIAFAIGAEALVTSSSGLMNTADQIVMLTSRAQPVSKPEPVVCFTSLIDQSLQLRV